MIARKPTLAIIIFFITAGLVQADSSVFKYNLNLGMNRKEAKKTLYLFPRLLPSLQPVLLHEELLQTHPF